SLQNHNVDYIVAPYEADAQMAYLCMSRKVEGVITEDSDVLVYGASKVFTKTDIDSNTAFLIEASKLDQCFNVDNWTFLKFIYICILAGCDYLESIPSIGIKRAIEFVQRIKEKDIFQAIPQMGLYLNRQITIPERYASDFKKCLDIFRHHLVFDLEQQKLVPLNPYEDFHQEMPYAGDVTDKGQASRPSVQASQYRVASEAWGEHCLGLAIGNLSIKDLSIINNFDPPAIFNQSLNLEITVTGLEEALVWTLPCCPVIKLSLRVVKILAPQSSQFADLSHGVVKLSDERLCVVNLPALIKCINSDCCTVNINNRSLLMLWNWTISDDNSVSDDDLPLYAMSISSFTSNTTSTAVSNDYNNEDDPADIEHSLPFKVLGVCHVTKRQEILQEAYIRLYEQKLPVKTRIRPDPSNIVDKNAIAVDLDVGNGWQHIGFLPSELVQYVHPPLREGKISMVKIDHIRFRTTWTLIGFYAKITMTKLGSVWDDFVIQKSKTVR
ncbi:uncharacterized protein LOC144350428, partial [Saccoglossus kowalevskii]